jgi:uncharacterized protein YbjT (DUF2867 family)
VARALLGRGHRVLALTRHPRSGAARRLANAGAQLVAGDFEDAVALRGALAGADGPVDGVFVVSTPFEAGTQAEVRQGIAVLEAAAAAGAGHVVYSSVASADRRTGVPHFESKFRVEERLRSLEVSWTVLGPVSFLDGFASGWARRSVAEGKFEFPMDGAKALQVVVLEDLGLLAALVFEQPGRLRGRRIEVASDDLVYAVLTLTVLIALMTIANAVSLAVHERTRELGLLRAIGQTRAQLRSMVRWDATIAAAFGCLLGLVVGTFTGWSVVRAAAAAGKSLGPVAITSVTVPAAQLVIVLVAGTAAGYSRPAARPGGPPGWTC